MIFSDGSMSETQIKFWYGSFKSNGRYTESGDPPSEKPSTCKNVER